MSRLKVLLTVCLSLVLICLLAIAPAFAQSNQVASAPINYQRVTPDLQQLGVPLHLPTKLVYRNTLVGPNTFFAVGGVMTDPNMEQQGYRVQITNSQNCLNGSLSCIIAYANAEPLRADQVDIESMYAWFRAPGALDRYVRVSSDSIGWVRLSNGQSVYFVPWVMGAGMGFAQAMWDEGGYRYTIGLKGGARAWLLPMAETAFGR
ncbi:hypothetical protein H6F86_05625 [Phormidium sp. FACHB-592]|uniref:Uncharacterized protein n=1 Tax=Stenomitos frigidus AS-A4 TaxID=2933935 RepID=A0ABV0KPE9_9CYAN|nr:hypothetical protein [Phormidium sp. FACHB-592]MBD2073371.1 hypothetical protein [Phormidium sp. FACHB-592]